MEMPDWFNSSAMAKGPLGINPPPMMQMPQVNSQPVPSGPPGVPPELWAELTARGAAGSSMGEALAPPSQMASGGFSQAPPQMGAGSFQMPPMPPQRPPQEALMQRVAALGSPAGGLGGDSMFSGGAPGQPMQLPSAGGAPPVTVKPERMVGPGSWLPKGIGDLIDKNSLVGKILAMTNASPAPGGQPQQQMTGLLPQLYRGLFG